jgi:hypothetical protein
LNQSERSRDPRVVRRWVWMMGSLLLVVGCHARQSGDTSILERIVRAARSKTETRPGELAAKGLAAITEECAKQSYKTASKGLIVSETGLHEDVFALRDRVSYGQDAFRLDEALQLESLLHAETEGLGHPTEQAGCVQEFAEYLEALTDPMVEADERQKELDLSSFKDSAKEAQEQADKRLSDSERPAEPKTQVPGSQPQ